MITGTEFVPGNPAIVHHAILYAAYPQQVAAAEQLDGAGPRPRLRMLRRVAPASARR